MSERGPEVDLLAALLTLDRNEQVAQLKAAKVPQHTIDALYPKVFEDLVPGLIDFLGEYDLVAFDGNDGWASYADSTNALLRDVSVDLSAQAKREFERFVQEDAYSLLHDHLESGVTGKAAEFRIAAMIRGLFYAYWFMLRAEDSGAYPRISDYFVEIIQWLLPELRQRVAFQIESGR